MLQCFRENVDMSDVQCHYNINVAFMVAQTRPWQIKWAYCGPPLHALTKRFSSEKPYRRLCMDIWHYTSSGEFWEKTWPQSDSGGRRWHCEGSRYLLGAAWDGQHGETCEGRVGCRCKLCWLSRSADADGKTPCAEQGKLCWPTCRSLRRGPVGDALIQSKWRCENFSHLSDPTNQLKTPCLLRFAVLIYPDFSSQHDALLNVKIVPWTTWADALQLESSCQKSSSQMEQARSRWMEQWNSSQLLPICNQETLQHSDDDVSVHCKNQVCHSQIRGFTHRCCNITETLPLPRISH